MKVKCVKDTTIEGISVGQTYNAEYCVVYKIIYNETDTTFQSVVGNKDWFYEYFEINGKGEE